MYELELQNEGRADAQHRYNNRNRLDQLTIGTTVTANYTYDGLERLAIRTTQNMTPSGTTHYVYDLSGHLIAESSDTGTTVREYVWLDDMPLAVVADVDTASPNLYYVHADHLNRPIKMTDGSKTVVWDAVYWPFGEVSSITGSASNNLRFPGQYFLIESGLHYNWHRHYDPSLGRYTQPDPLGIGTEGQASDTSGLPAMFNSRLGDLNSNTAAVTHVQGSDNESAVSELAAVGFQDGPSVYAYVRSAPTMGVDPQGLFSGPFIPVPSFSKVQQCSWIAGSCDQAFNQCIKVNPMSMSATCYDSWKACNSYPHLPVIFPGGVYVPGGRR